MSTAALEVSQVELQNVVWEGAEYQTFLKGWAFSSSSQTPQASNQMKRIEIKAADSNVWKSSRNTAKENPWKHPAFQTETVSKNKHKTEEGKRVECFLLCWIMLLYPNT